MTQPDPSERKHLILRGVFFTLGLVFTALGFIGALLPVMPTVPFLIVAAACFTRSSPRLEAWLLAHPTFGPLLVNWREKGAIPRRAKYFALVGCLSGFAMMQLLGLRNVYMSVAVAALMLGGLAFVFTRPDA